MLTADQVRVRKKGDELTLVSLAGPTRERAEALAGALLAEARALVGATREELDQSWDALAGDEQVPARIAAGIRKLVEDACVFDGDSGKEAYEMRRALFTRASAARRELGDAERLDRQALLALVAADLSVTPEVLERSLFADLRGADLLASAPTEDAKSILGLYDLGQAQAVLLRAVRVTCDVRAASPGATRAFFSKLKFHKLLFAAERLPKDEDKAAGFRVVVDGPFSMFDSVTKYGLRLALLLPALRELESWSLVADVRWGKDRAPCTFRLRSAAGPARARAPKPQVSDEVRELIEAITRAEPAWRAEPATTLLDLPGFGMCVPDLVLRRDAETVFVEVLGFWSRDAVWRRIELARAGLAAKIVFAVSDKLRVSSEMLDGTSDAALYVYKGKMNARALLQRVEEVAR